MSENILSYRHPVWGLAFRPFFLMGSLVAAFLVAFWSISFFRADVPIGFFDPVIWHAHEMTYGFAMAIVAGFILTAGATWTGTKGLSGGKLFALFLIWFVARILFVLSLFDLPISPLVFFIVDMLFIPGLMWALAMPLVKSGQWRNIQFLLVFGVMALGNIIIHLASLGVLDASFAYRGVHLGVNLILLVMVIIGGRVIPFFTANALGDPSIKKIGVIEKVTLISVCSYIFVDFIVENEIYSGRIALIAAVFNLVRMLGWKPWKTLKSPILWILHVGYLWIVVGFILIYLSAAMDLLPRSVALHAFTAGAMGTFIIGMMSRVSLGHTGRPLKLAKGLVVSYALITLSGGVRVASSFLSDYYFEGILVSGIFWALSFLTFFLFYFKILMSPRADGRPG